MYRKYKKNIVCPECLESALVKNGHIMSGGVLHQWYKCKNCGRLTIKPIDVDRLDQKNLILKPV